MAIAEDLCEAYRYQWEVTAGYCLSKGSGILQAMTDSFVEKTMRPLIHTFQTEIVVQIQDLKDKQNELLTCLGKEIKDLRGEFNKQNQLVTCLAGEIKELRGEFNELRAVIHNDRMRKKNDDGYAKYLQSSKDFGNLRVFPLVKENPGQMNVAPLSSASVIVPAPLKEAPLIGKTYEARVQYVTSASARHVPMVQRGFRHLTYPKLKDRQFAIAAWLSGRTFSASSDQAVSDVAAAAVPSPSPPRRRQISDSD